MNLLPTNADPDVRERLDRLASELRETKRDLQRVRIERRILPALVLLVVAVFGTVGTRSTQAQNSGRVVAPFAVVDQLGRELFKVESINDRPAVRAGLVVMGTGASGGGYLSVEHA